MAITTAFDRQAILRHPRKVLIPDGTIGARDRWVMIGQFNPVTIIVNLSETLNSVDALGNGFAKDLTEALFFSDNTFVTVTIVKNLMDRVSITDWLTVRKSSPSSTFTEL